MTRYPTRHMTRTLTLGGSLYPWHSLHVTTDVTNQPRGHARYRLCPECHMTGYLSKAHQSVRLGPTVRRIKRANIPERPAD